MSLLRLPSFRSQKIGQTEPENPPNWPLPVVHLCVICFSITWRIVMLKRNVRTQVVLVSAVLAIALSAARAAETTTKAKPPKSPPAKPAKDAKKTPPKPAAPLDAQPPEPFRHRSGDTIPNY